MFSGDKSHKSVLLQIQRLEAALRLSGNVLRIIQLEHSVPVVTSGHHMVELFHLHLLVRRNHHWPVAQVVTELNMTVTKFINLIIYI